MKKILLLILLLLSLLSSQSQSLIGCTTSTVTNYMKKQDIFSQAEKNEKDGGASITYLGSIHKNGRLRTDEDYSLVYETYYFKNDKCVGEFYLYRYSLLNKYLSLFNTSKSKYKNAGHNKWIDKKENVSIQINLLPEDGNFSLQYLLNK